ncbi:MAG: putative transposase [Bacteroidia bacterium]|jgi:putative transposase
MKFKSSRKTLRQSIRLKNWDYANLGSYFITISIRYRKQYFGEVVDGKLLPSKLGEIVESEWLRSVNLRPQMNLHLGAYVVMPDHFHGLITFGNVKIAAYENRPEYKNNFGPQSNNLASLIRGFKSAITTKARIMGHSKFNWTIGYHESIIKSEVHYQAVTKYILNNRKNWVG